MKMSSELRREREAQDADVAAPHRISAPRSMLPSHTARASQCTRNGARRLALGVLLAALAAPSTAFADAAAEADKHFHRGVDLYKDNDYSGALVEFQRANEIMPSWQVLYNIGESHFQLQDYANALKTLTRYLNEGGKKVPAKRRKEVEKDIEKLKQRVATLKVGTSEPGATVTVDDIPVGTTPLAEPLIVSAGRRRVTATLAPRPPVTEVVQVAGGDTLTVSLTIPPLPPKVEVVTKPASSITIPVIAWVTTGAVAAGAVTTGILALGASSDLKQQLGLYPADPKAISSAHGKALSFSIATDVLTAAALAGAGVSIYLTIRQQRGDTEPTKPANSPSARLVVYPNGVGVAGSF
ncbi:TonB-dependent receptor [Minicystis rosea]|nr:TonB-dependent receptor [Minicystis rosea]